MPLFDSVLQEKPAIVLDMGYYTAAGFAGEQHPRFILNSEVKIGNELKNIHNYKTVEELYDHCVMFLNNVFYKHLLVNPKDRKIVIVESILSPTKVRDTLAKIFFQHFEVASIYFVPSHLVCLATLGIDTGLVVDIGHSEAVVLPVYSGVVMLKAYEAQNLSAENIHNEIKSKLILDGIEEKLLTNDVVEDIKVRTCFVTSFDRAKKILNNEGIIHPPDVDYPIKGDKIIKISGVLRETAFEVLFPNDNDHLGLPYIILNSILRSPIDTRKQLAENIFIIGGTSMAKGLVARLKNELLSLIQTDLYKDKLHVNSFKFHISPFHTNISAWLGGSIYGATDIILSGSITRETYFQNPRIPDWFNYDDEEFRNHGNI